MTRLCLSTLALVTLICSAGCSYVKTPAVAFSDDGDYLPPDVGKGLVVAPNPLIPDVPMPVGFKAVPSQSFWRYDGQVRVVRHVYQGHCKQGEVVEFYQRVLPEHNWTLVDMQGVGESTVVRYAKGPENLAITAKHTWGVSTITIDIDAR